MAAEHKTNSGYGPHDWDCLGCVEDAKARAERMEASNPHRKGTKAYERRAREDAMVRLACDPRSETYWSM